MLGLGFALADAQITLGNPLGVVLDGSHSSDAVLDQLAYSRGRFAVEVQGQETLIVPAWAEISRVIEECRG